MDISGTTNLYGVIGHPIRHSLSPKIYNTGFKHYDIDAVYMAFDCTEDDTARVLDAARALNICGLNVTMPCKKACFELVDKVEGAAKYVGAVNTIKNENGILTGHITDGTGLVLDLKDHGVDVTGKDIVLIGVGGAGSAILAQLALDGAKSVHTFNRGIENLNRVEKMGNKMNSEGVGATLNFSPLSDEKALSEAIKNADILINASSVGMAPDSLDQSPIPDASVLHKNLVVYDVIYNPAVTKLMNDAKSAGCHVIGGKGMLFWQAYGAFEIYTGLKLPVERNDFEAS